MADSFAALTFLLRVVENSSHARIVPTCREYPSYQLVKSRMLPLEYSPDLIWAQTAS